VRHTEGLRGGFADSRGFRFEGPGNSEHDPRAVQISLAAADELIHMPNDQVGAHFLSLLGIHAATVVHDWSTGPKNPGANDGLLARYQFYLHTPLYPRPGFLRVDLTRNDPPSRAQQVWHAAAAAGRLLWTGEAPDGFMLPSTPSVTVSSLRYPPPAEISAIVGRPVENKAA